MSSGGKYSLNSSGNKQQQQQQDYQQEQDQFQDQVQDNTNKINSNNNNNSNQNSFQQQQQQQQQESPYISNSPSPKRREPQNLDDIHESPFKNHNKDYGEKYNKVINKLRDSNTINDLARKYNKITLTKGQNQNSSQTTNNWLGAHYNASLGQRFVYCDSESKNDLNSSAYIRQSNDNNNNNNNFQSSQHKRQTSHNLSFQTPSKTENSHMSLLNSSQQKFSISNNNNNNGLNGNIFQNILNNNNRPTLQHKKLDSFDLRQSGVSQLSKKTNDSAIPGILAQIQQKQKNYKSPTNNNNVLLGLRSSQTFLSPQNRNLNSLQQELSGFGQQPHKNYISSNNSISYNTNRPQLQQQQNNNINNNNWENVSFLKKQPFKQQQEYSEITSNNAKQLKKNFKNFLHDVSLGYGATNGSSYRRAVSPKAFVRTSSPIRTYHVNKDAGIEGGLAGLRILSPQSNRQQQQQQQPQQNNTFSSSFVLGSENNNNNNRKQGLNDLLSRISRTKQQHNFSASSTNANTLLQQQQLQQQSQNMINNNSSSIVNSSLYGNLNSHSHHAPMGKLIEFEQDLDKQRLSSMFTLSKNRGSDPNIFRSPSFKKRNVF